LRAHHFLILVIAVAAVAVVGSSYKESRQQSQIVTSALAAGGVALEKAGIPQSCAGKKFCITAFIAPWCGVCNHSIPAFRSINKYVSKNRTDIGFGLVIGAGEPGENQSKKKELSDIESYVDQSGAVMDKRNIKAFPTWVVVNDSGKEIFRKAAGINLPDENSVRGFVLEMVGR
jgi:hypothetical protein